MIENLPRYYIRWNSHKREQEVIEHSDADYIKVSELEEVFRSALPDNQGESFSTTKDGIIQALRNLSVADRGEILGVWCGYCGDENLNCQCWNEE